MRFGVCIATNISKIPVVKAAGYDYVEMSLVGVAGWSDEKVAEVRAILDKEGIEMEATNGFFGFEEGYLTDDRLDLKVVEEYTRRAMKNASQLGLKVAVLGSGTARQILDESKRDQAEEQFVQVLRLCGDICAEYGVKIAIEPLRTEETNFINTVADGLEMCKKANHPNVFVLADFYHVFMNGESLDTVRTCGDMLQHTHIARSNPDRLMPVNPEDMAACKEWAAALKENGYDLRMSLEGGFGEDWDATVIKMRDVLKVFE